MYMCVYMCVCDHKMFTWQRCTCICSIHIYVHIYIYTKNHMLVYVCICVEIRLGAHQTQRPSVNLLVPPGMEITRHANTGLLGLPSSSSACLALGWFPKQGQVTP